MTHALRNVTLFLYRYFWYKEKQENRMACGTADEVLSPF